MEEIKQQIYMKIEYLKTLNSDIDIVRGQLIGLSWILALIKEIELREAKNNETQNR